MKGRRKPRQEPARDASSEQPSARVSLPVGEQLTLADLRMIAQIDGCKAEDVLALTEKGERESGTAGVARQALEKWLADHKASARSLCSKCSLTVFLGAATCAFCGNSLQGGTQIPVIAFTPGSAERWKALCQSFPAIGVTLVCLGVPLLIIGLVVLTTASLR